MFFNTDVMRFPAGHILGGFGSILDGKLGAAFLTAQSALIKEESVFHLQVL